MVRSLRVIFIAHQSEFPFSDLFRAPILSLFAISRSANYPTIDPPHASLDSSRSPLRSPTSCPSCFSFNWVLEQHIALFSPGRECKVDWVENKQLCLVDCDSGTRAIVDVCAGRFSLACIFPCNAVSPNSQTFL